MLQDQRFKREAMGEGPASDAEAVYESAPEPAAAVAEGPMGAPEGEFRSEPTVPEVLWLVRRLRGGYWGSRGCGWGRTSGQRAGGGPAAGGERRNPPGMGDGRTAVLLFGNLKES